MTDQNTEIQLFFTGANPPKIRTDKWLAQHLPQYSRSQIQSWFHAGAVTCNGTPLKPGETLPPKADIHVHPLDVAQTAPPEAEEIPFEILWEDPHLLVINKPAGLVVHPAPGHPDGTLINALLSPYPDLAGVGDPMRPGLVHRLDADTSGVILFARTPAALEHLQNQFRDRQIHKTYQTLVHGIPNTSHGTIDLPLGRHPQDRKRRAVHGLAARPALTHWKMLAGLANGTAAHFEVQIETGRTHQIRVHLQHLGHPVLGDTLYGGRSAQLSGSWPQAPRQMLHAFRLQFLHPATKRPLEITAPLPPDMTAYIAQLQLHRP